MCVDDLCRLGEDRTNKIDQSIRHLNLDTLRVRYEHLISQSAKLSNRRQRRQCNLHDSSTQLEHDAISDLMLDLTSELSSFPAQTLRDMQLKALLLLDVLPDEADPTVSLAVSLCDDIVRAATAQCDARRGP